jgi:hypothetical protein
MPLLRCLAGAALALGASCAFAQIEAGAKADRAAAFARLDRNGDGVLSRREAGADPEIAKRFERFDENADKLLSADEFDRAKSDQEQQYLFDASLTARVKAALLLEPGLPSAAIAVETSDGIVALNGTVELVEQVARAGRTAARVGGVRSVHNDLRVRRADSRGREGFADARR